MCVLHYEQQNKQIVTFIDTRKFQAKGPVHAGAAIVEALTAATKPEDLVDAFAWFENAFPSQQAQALLETIRYRATLVHGCTAPRDSVPVPTRALNNEVAYMMIRALGLAFNIRLTGLCSATHLSNREGVIRGEDPVDGKQWTARLADGTRVSVRAANFVHICRGDSGARRRECIFSCGRRWLSRQPCDWGAATAKPKSPRPSVHRCQR